MSTISGTVTHSITLATTGVYTSPLTIAATGSVSNNGTGDAIYGPATNAWMVTNLGRVSATGSYSAIDLRAGGSISNRGTIVGGAGGDAGAGISLSGGGAIDNAGTIAGGVGIAGGSGTSDVYIGGAGGIAISLSGGGTIDNAGTIAGGAGGAGYTKGYYGGDGGAGGIAISLSGGGSIENSRMITGGAGGSGTSEVYIGGAGGIAISLSGGGTIDNAGTIAGGVGGAGYTEGYYGGDGGAGGIAISLSSSGSFDNTGTIAGGPGGAGGSGGGPLGIGGAGDGGDGGAGVVLSASGSIGNWGTIAGGAGGAPGADGRYHPFGQPGAAGAGVVLHAGGIMTNGSAGGDRALIEGSIGIQALGTSGTTVINFGTVAGLTGASGGNGNVYVNGGPGGSGGSGIVLSSGGSIANWGTVEGGNGGNGGSGHYHGNGGGHAGNGGNGGAGVVLSASGSIGNWGTVEGGNGGNGGSGYYSGGTGGAGGDGIVLSNSGSIGNWGTIVGGAGGQGGVDHSGHASPDGTAGVGIVLSAGGIVTNGSSASTVALIRGAADGVRLVDGGTITNFGTIEGVGGTAVAIGNGAAGKVIVEPGAVFVGKVIGGGNSEIDFAAAGVAGMSNVSGFKTIQLGNGGTSSLLLTNANFAGVSGATITVDGGNPGKTVNASTVTGSNRVVLIGGFGADSFTGGAGNDIFQFAAANLTAADTVQGRSGADQLRMTSPGTIAAFGVSGVETYTLANGGANSLTLTDANFDGVSGAAITVDGGNGGNTVNASALTAANRVIVVGGAGKDIFTGGAGNDVFRFTVANLAASDTVKGGAGSDQLVMTSAGTVLAGGVSGVETYTLANGGANSLTLVNANFSGVTGSTITVDGGNGGNMVDASALSGANRVIVTGGAGNDTFKFSAANLQSTDVVKGGLGTDRLVMTSAGAIAAGGVGGVETFQLAGGGANSLTLADANFAGVTGTTITVDGGNAGNTVNASALTGANRVIVTGGGGNDQLTGGAGNDIFEFSAANLQSTDVVKGGLGTDRLVMMSAGAVAASGVSGVETYSLSDGGASSLLLTNANFAGVSGATITVDGGNPGKTVNASTVTGSNRVVLIGGFGADSFTGGAGNDIFQFAAANLTAADTVQGRSGADQLRMTSPGTIAAFGVSGVETYTLANGGANSLTLTDANFDGVSGAAITVDGGNGGNTVNASALTAANRVIVVGGAGKDIFTGGAGNDVFRFTVANLAASDTVKGGAGSDQLVMTSAGTVLAGGVSGVETYTLANGGANSLTLVNANFSGVTGSTITVDGGNGGNMVDASALSGANRVIVVGSTGADTLITAQHAAMTGGGGADLFELTTPGSATLPDTNTIADFTHASDRIAVSNAGFGLGLAGASTTSQALPATLFSSQSNGSFTTAAQRFAYNSASGALYFDADGSAAGSSPRLIATLTTHPVLATTDMTFVS